MTREAGLFFCVDGGGSRSRARLLDREGRALAEATSGPCNPATNFERAVASVTSLWTQCCVMVGRPADRLDGVAFAVGAAGTYIEVDRKTFLAACPPFSQVCAMSDGYAALIGAGAGAPCSLLVIGTGVAGHRLYANGWSIQRDAWGWIAGDRGSGSWIGQRALRHCLAALDGVMPKDGLSRAVLAAIGGVDTLRGGWLRELAPNRLAALAPLVLELADAGEVVAQRIRERAVDHLASLVAVISGPDTPLFAAGGLVSPLRTLIEERSGFPISAPIGDALAGCWLAGMGMAPAERVLLFGKSAEDAR